MFEHVGLLWYFDPVFDSHTTDELADTEGAFAGIGDVNAGTAVNAISPAAATAMACCTKMWNISESASFISIRKRCSG